MPELDLHGLRRVLELRQFRLLEQADVDELATLAENLVETRIAAGTLIATAGSRLGSVHLILDGCIETRPERSLWSARNVFGALEAFANRDVAHTSIAATPLRTLQLSASNLNEVLEDNFGVLRVVLRELSSRVLALAPAPRLIPPAGRGPLGLVERLIVLRHQLPFATARLQALATLAHASDELTWPADTIVARAGEPATSAFVITAGSALATRDSAGQLLHAGSSIGLLETLAAAPHVATIETTTPVRALRCSGSAILDVIEDHTDVGLAMLATFASALLARPTHAVATDTTTPIAA